MLFFKPKHETLFIQLFTLMDKSAVIPTSEAGWNQRVHVVMEDLIPKYYFEQLKPPKKWNYLYIHVEMPSLPSHEDFRNEATNEVYCPERFNETCLTIKSFTRTYLERKNPAYGHNALEKGLVEMKYDWFPRMNMIVLSTILPGYEKWGNEDFKNS